MCEVKKGGPTYRLDTTKGRQQQAYPRAPLSYLLIDPDAIEACWSTIHQSLIGSVPACIVAPHWLPGRKKRGHGVSWGWGFLRVCVSQLVGVVKGRHRGM